MRTATDSSRLEPGACDLLRTLVARPGLTVSREHLIETVWGQDEGSAGILSHAVSTLRQALGDDDRAPRFIETVPGLGYRWIFEEPPERLRPLSSRWVGRVWAAGGAALAAVVGGRDGTGARAVVAGPRTGHHR
ncbi:helix-turn-helix domain-containing protein [Caulobacter sp. FWC2]|uniref:winged helix-turn-helix domain-containing protein n=1 Tax=Caulobacter sp. FWC2 TaxID=69664 RepID=UPI002100F895|nr:helix-turn-helix domain-containing protein [Caulobacter sp. FWC2]